MLPVGLPGYRQRGVFRQSVPATLQELLQPGLWVLEIFDGWKILQPFTEYPPNNTLGFGKALIEIDGAKDRLDQGFAEARVEARR